MARETLLHIDETLTEAQRENLLTQIRPFAGNVTSCYRSEKPHLVFVCYNEELTAPQELLAMTHEAGVSAQLVSW